MGEDKKKNPYTNVNVVVLTGNLTRDPEVRQGATTKMGRFTLAVNDIYDTDFVSCKVFGKEADFLEQHCHKGSSIEIRGRIKTSSYEKNGSTVYVTEVVGDSLSFAGGGRKKEEPTE